MRRAMAGREIGGNNERRDLASVFSPVPSAAWFWRCDSRSYASSGPASNRLPPSVAAAGLFSRRSSDHLNSTGNQSVVKQCGAQWQAAKAGGTTGGATWPPFLKSCRAQLASTTSAPPSGGFMPAPAPAPAPAPFASTDAIGFTVSVATASNCTRWKRRIDRRRVCVGAGSSVSLSGINCRLGQ
jgi:hypothetical protein